MAKKPQKGVAGKRTGANTRRAIAAKRKAGSSTKQIARAAMRSPKTITGIENNDIHNPPSNLAGKIRKAKTTKKRGR